MDEKASGQQVAGTRFRDFSDELRVRFRHERPHTRVLRIAHPLSGGVREGGAKSPTAPLGLVLDLPLGAGETHREDGPGLRCHSRELPFADGTFRCVMLYHVIAAGEEPELPEACRVLAPGGDLLIIGLNRYGWAGVSEGVWAGVPRLRPSQVCQRLQESDMVIESRMGAGLAGRWNPGEIGGSLRRLALPVADVVLLHVRHRSRPTAIRPKLKDVPAGLAPTALASR